MTISSLISSRPQVIETAVKVVLTWTILIGQFASGDDFCDSMSGDPTDECASELSCYGCTVPITNLNETLQETFSECIHSDSVGGHLAKCYKTDAKACAVVKIYNVKDQVYTKVRPILCPPPLCYCLLCCYSSLVRFM